MDSTKIRRNTGSVGYSFSHNWELSLLAETDILPAACCTWSRNVGRMNLRRNVSLSLL